MDVALYFYNPHVPEAEEGGTQSQRRPGLLSQNNKQTSLCMLSSLAIRSSGSKWRSRTGVSGYAKGRRTVMGRSFKANT